MGLGFAMLYDPRAGGNSVVISRYLNTIAMLAFLVFDGHLQMISALVQTFQSVPVSANVLGSAVHARGWQTLATYGVSVFSTGLLLSLPVVTALLIANLALGILNRAAPQIGIFQVGFPVTMLVGFLLIQLMIPNMIPFFQRIFDTGIDQMGRVAAAL
jgi:flagellar biosynthetic protein FliR